MREFFKGWRRKLGMVMLVIACMFAAGWLRSLTREDVCAITVFGRRQCFDSLGGTLHWWGWNDPDGQVRYRWKSGAARRERPLLAASMLEMPRFRFRLDENGEEYFDIDDDSVSASTVKFAPPYWSIFMPLTLLSAYLLLSKARPAPKTTEPAPTTGD